MKVALIQEKFSKNKIEKTRKKILKASKIGAKLVILCELHQTEYFCQSQNPKFFAYAKNFDKDLLFWSKVAKEASIVLVTSLFEKRAKGIYHNTAVVFEKDGTIAGEYRKMHIPDDPGFYENFYFTKGDLGFNPIQTSLGKLGILICWDQWFSEPARILTLKGADILIYPTAIGHFKEDSKKEKQRQLKAWVNVQRGHAISNGINLIAVNRTGFEKDSSGVLNGINFWGTSFACDPQGKILAKASKNKEEILIVNIKKKRISKVRNIWPFLRDRRIDAYEDILKRYVD